MPDGRLPAGPASELRAGDPVGFTFDGKLHDGVAGDTIASALVADGVTVLSRSFKYHRPRAVLCAAGRCPNCLVEVDGIPNVRACVTPVQGGMRVRSQNAWPSLRFDLLSLTDRFDRLLPVGFYYKTFIRPRRLWPLYEAVLRRVAGLGRIDPKSRPELGQRKRHAWCDVAVIGGGPAGCFAAIAAAEGGARVMLIDDGVRLGGHLRLRTRPVGGDPRLEGLAGQAAAQRLEGLVSSEPRIEVLRETTAVGIYESGLVAAVRDTLLTRIRAKRIIVATGAAERPALFGGNDRPGVMHASGILRLAHLHGVRSGSRAVVVTDDDHGWRQAAELAAAGIGVVALLDTRPQPARSGTDGAVASGAAGSGGPAFGVEVLAGVTVLESRGRNKVTGLRLRTADGASRTIDCDLVAMAMRPEPVVALAAQAGVRLRYEDRVGEWVPEPEPDGLVLAAGDVTAPASETLALEGAILAGRRAAGREAGEPVVGMHQVAIAAARADLTPPPAATVPAGHKPFVCLCEDVTAKELVQGMDEGFASLETLKRYSTVTMGPCQGRQCQGNTARLHAAIRGISPAESGLTTFRPPYASVPLAVVAGPHLSPIRRTALHDRHAAAGAVWMDMGDWKRPLHYGDVDGECRAVRQGVGLIDISTLGKLDVRGRDAGEFLDWLHPNRFSDLRIGRVRYRAMLDDGGIILDDGTVSRLDETRFFVSTGTGSLESVDAWLRWWLATGERRVDVADVTSQFAAMNLAGPAARDVLARVADLDVTREALPYLGVVEGRVAGVPAIVMRIGFVGELAYEIHLPADYATHAWDALMAAGAAAGIRPFGVEAQRVLRLEKQHAIVGQDTDALSNPIESGMGWLIKADRPDFIGRDAVLAVLGRGSQDALVGFEASGSDVPAEGAAVVRDGRVIGRVTSAKWSPTLERPIGLVWLRAEDAKDGRPIRVRLGVGREGRTTEAVVRTAPFYDPAGERLRA